MNDKHVMSNIGICQKISESSSCPRLKVGAMIVDPVRNTIVGTGYNGGPRGGEGPLCGGAVCYRDGAPADRALYSYYRKHTAPPHRGPEVYVVVVGRPGSETTMEIDRVQVRPQALVSWVNGERNGPDPEDQRRRTLAHDEMVLDKVEEAVAAYQAKYRPVPSGEKVEVGCVHAEANAIYNCAHDGVSTAGRWMFTLAGPCLSCAKAIHHSGIGTVVVVKGGYVAEGPGIEYMRNHGVDIMLVDGPQDPRTLITEADDNG